MCIITLLQQPTSMDQPSFFDKTVPEQLRLLKQASPWLAHYFEAVYEKAEREGKGEDVRDELKQLQKRIQQAAEANSANNKQ